MSRLSQLQRLTTAAVAVLTIGLVTSVAPLAADADPAPAPAKHYVDCSKRTPGAGTSAAPWNTLQAVNDHGAFIPGDQILIKRGTTCKGRVFPTGSGRKGAPILLGAYGTSKNLPTLAGGGTPIGTGVVQLVDVHDWTVQDLHITNKGKARETSAYRAGVLVINSGVGRLAGLKIQHLRVDGVVSNLMFGAGNAREFGGISAVTYGTKKSGFDGLQILNNRVDHVGRTGIVVSNHQYPKSVDSGLRISGNSVSWTRGDSIIIAGSKNARIDHNTSAHGANFWPCAQCGGITPSTANAAIWATAASGIRIDHNEVSGEHFLGGDGEAFDVDAGTKNVVVEYNYAHDNQGGGILFCGSTDAIARFNIFQNNNKSAFAFIGNMPAKNTQIYNNTVYNSAKSKSRVVRYFNGAHGSKITFKNNLLYVLGKGYSAYYWPNKPQTSANTLIGYHGAGRPSDSRTRYTNPGLKNPGSGKTGFGSLKGYKPVHPSTFTRGVAIPKTVTRDFFGKKINPKKPPRGAAG